MPCESLLLRFATIWIVVTLVTSRSKRGLQFKNSCPNSVRVGFTSGALGSSTSCKSNQNCPTGAICNTEIGSCFYMSPFTEGHLDLNAASQTDINIDIEDGMNYGGAIYASTGCDTYSNACETAICRNKTCGSLVGPVGPHTRAEFFFNPAGVDFYDISVMHGINVPLSMQAVGGKKVPGDSYSCGTAGSVFVDNDLPKCSYKYNSTVNNIDQASNIVFVAAADLINLQFCETTADCKAELEPDANSSAEIRSNDLMGEIVCGLHAGRDPTGAQTTEVQRVCGKAVGVWSADEVCVYSNGQYSAAPYHCDKKAQHGSYMDLLGCAGAYANSGYQPNQNSEFVCGCYDWDLPSESKCKSSNPEWVDVALPWAKLFKEMCPVAYSYAFDDMTSTFTCTGGSDLTYVLEFCPQGVVVDSL